MLHNFFRNTLPKYGQLLLFGGSSIAFFQGIKDQKIKNLYIEKLTEANKLKEQIDILKQEKLKVIEDQITESDLSALKEIDRQINSCLSKLHSNTQIFRNNSNLSPEQVSDLNAEATENMSNIVDNTSNLSKIVKKYLDKYNPKDGTSNLLSILDNFFNGKLFSGMSIEEIGAVVHISGSLFLLFSIFTIISILFGNTIIEKYNLEKRFPKLAKLFQLRKKATKYSLILNFSLIILVLLIIISLNVYILYTV